MCGLGGKGKEGGEGVKMGGGTLEKRLRALEGSQDWDGLQAFGT